MRTLLVLFVARPMVVNGQLAFMPYQEENRRVVTSELSFADACHRTTSALYQGVKCILAKEVNNQLFPVVYIDKKEALEVCEAFSPEKLEELENLITEPEGYNVFIPEVREFQPLTLEQATAIFQPKGGNLPIIVDNEPKKASPAQIETFISVLKKSVAALQPKEQKSIFEDLQDLPVLDEKTEILMPPGMNF